MIVDANSHLGSIHDKEAYEFWLKNGEIMERVVWSYFEPRAWVDKSIVVGFPQGPHINDNACLAHFAKLHPDKVTPFMLLDPKAAAPLDEIARIVDMGGTGVFLAPIYQNFRPDDEACFPIYETLEKRKLPVMWFQGSSAEAPDGPLEWANPVLLDKIARTFPELRMLISHFGSPWFREVIALTKKHKHVYTEISALSHRTFALYTALIEAVQYGVDDKIMFGSEFPMQTPDQNREALYETCTFGESCNFPRVSKAVIDKIIARDVYALLGLA